MLSFTAIVIPFHTFGFVVKIFDIKVIEIHRLTYRNKIQKKSEANTPKKTNNMPNIKKQTNNMPDNA